MANEGADPEPAVHGATVLCKGYHDPKRGGQTGVIRRNQKAICPSWAMDAAVQEVLIRGALARDDEQEDAFGRPKRLWNAVDNKVFVGVSCNMQSPTYNCYPENPPDGALYNELIRRAERSLEEVLREAGLDQ
jgi:hypothetical protein